MRQNGAMRRNKVHTNLTDEQLAWVRAQAKHNGSSPAQVLRSLVIAAMVAQGAAC